MEQFLIALIWPIVTLGGFLIFVFAFPTEFRALLNRLVSIRAGRFEAKFDTDISALEAKIEITPSNEDAPNIDLAWKRLSDTIYAKHGDFPGYKSTLEIVHEMHKHGLIDAELHDLFSQTQALFTQYKNDMISSDKIGAHVSRLYDLIFALERRFKASS